jgi:AcrR family transcriptional regulator
MAEKSRTPRRKTALMDPYPASPRRAGRPDAQAAEALDRLILSTATRLFIEQGYAETSMEQIAASAGAGKQTLYRRYPGKEELFKAVIDAQTRTLLQSASRAESVSSDPMQGLYEVCRAAFELVLTPQMIDVHRVLVAEARRFPALADHSVENIVAPIEDVMRRLLLAARKTGQLRRNCDIETTMHTMTGLVTGWVMQQQLLGRKFLLRKQEQAAFFDAAWSIFLKGVEPR